MCSCVCLRVSQSSLWDFMADGNVKFLACRKQKGKEEILPKLDDSGEQHEDFIYLEIAIAAITLFIVL